MRFKLVGIGEVLWDLLPGGRQMGGAPANFAYHAAALGAEARVVSRVGRDKTGHELIRRLEQLGVPTCCIEEDPIVPTGTVNVVVAADGQPQFTIQENVAWDFISGEGAGRLAVAAADAVCFGTLAQRSETSRRTVRALLQTMQPDSLRILDVNLRQNFYSREIIEDSLALANVLKVNETELSCLAEMFALAGDERAQVAALARRFNLHVIALTRGSRGSLLHSGDEWSEIFGEATRVVDAVGAGDSFTAALTLGLLAGRPLDEVNRRASEVAAYVCSQPGATPALPPALCAPFQTVRSAAWTAQL
ncbi:MAG: carbohydrate kinase [Verrucomicrobiota bacterium]